MLLELAMLAGAATVGRAALGRLRGKRPTPVPVVPEPAPSADPPAAVPHRAEIGVSAGALVVAGAGYALRSTPLGLVSVPLTVWSARRQFGDAYRNLAVERRVGFAVLEGGVTLFSLASGALMLAAGNAVLHTIALSLQARETACNRAATRTDPLTVPESWLAASDAAVPTDRRLEGLDIVLRAGRTVPVDGRVVDGQVRIDARALDGGLTPRDLGPGDAVEAGQRVAAGHARVRVSAAGEHTARSRHVSANRRMPPTLEASALRADRVADASVGFTLPTAAIGGLVSGPSTVIAILGSNLFSAYRITAPLALQHHLDALATAGILVPDGRSFELLATVDRLCIDLGAVLDPERLELDVVVPGDGFDGARCLDWATAALRGVADPTATALLEALAQRGRTLPEAHTRSVDADGGATASIDGRRIEVASPAALDARGVRLDPHLARRRDPTDGRSVLSVAVDGREAALLRFEPTARPGAAALFRGLAELNIVPVLMSADRPAVGERWARRLGAPTCWGDLDGTQRTTVIDSMSSGRHAIAYLGAGTHDLPGMARVDVSLAADPRDPAVRAAADIVLCGQPLSQLVTVIEFARRYHRGQGRGIALTALATGTMGFASLAFNLGPIAALAAQALGLGAGMAIAAPDAAQLGRLPSLQPTADEPTPDGGRVPAADGRWAAVRT